ncbi:MAG TPA: J domain-containing protein [Solirubrobacteraceae bacterium]|nr:J domain-containing protein [Solirubrobacteraceae bacterium]
MDPYAILGVSAMDGEKEVSAAYREQAKRWHPDRGGGEQAARRMAEINAAYDLLRASFSHQASPAAPQPRRRRAARGSWLSDAVRKALGPELLDALSDHEAVRLVTPVSTWASPRTVLAVTEKRLLWLLDDAPVARVRSLAFRDVETVGLRLRRPRRRAATLNLRTTGGRRHSFADLRPHTAAVIERHVRDAVGQMTT